MQTLTVKQLVELVKKSITEVDVHQVHQMIITENPLIIDVREPSEFASGHIEGAINIPRGVLEFKLDPENSSDYPNLQNKDANMVVYCRSGARSALAVKSIQSLGYYRALSMAGGIEQWRSAGLPCTH